MGSCIGSNEDIISSIYQNSSEWCFVRVVSVLLINVLLHQKLNLRSYLTNWILIDHSFEIRLKDIIRANKPYGEWKRWSRPSRHSPLDFVGTIINFPSCVSKTLASWRMNRFNIQRSLVYLLRSRIHLLISDLSRSLVETNWCITTYRVMNFINERIDVLMGSPI